MTFQIGSAFGPLPTPEVEPEPDLLALRLELVLTALNTLSQSLRDMPKPEVIIDAPDLSAIVTAVNGLKPGVDADEIAAAVVAAIAPSQAMEVSDNPWQTELASTLKKLDFRLKGLGGGTSNANLPALLTAAPASDTGQASLPVRIISQLGAGSGGGSTASSVTINDPTTTTQKLAVDASGRITVNQAGTISTDVTDRTARLLGHVTVDSAPAVTGSVSVTNFPATQPVSGTFFQTTQPVSIAATVPVSLATAPTTPVTGTFFQATQPVSLATNTPDVTDRSARLLGHVTVDSAPAVTGSVSVTNFPATQPVSLATAPTTPVTGTFFQATQPVSIAATVTDDMIDRAARLLGVLSAGTNTIGNVGLVAGSAAIGTVAQAAITKGTQGTTGVTTQDLKDAGRAPVTYYMLIPVLATATDTLQSLTGTKGGATVTATTTPAVVTTGKTFRIQRFAATYIATATSGYAIARLRYNTGGVVTVTSPVLAEIVVGASTPATANASGSENAVVPDGLEVAAGTGIGISVQGFAAATATAVGYMHCMVSGYEY